MTNENLDEANVVFGATGGIGRAVCRTLAKRGSRLFVVGRDEQKAADVAAELGSPYTIIADTSPDGFEDCLGAAKAEFGHVTGVANCIGSFLLQPAHRTTMEEWDKTVATNLGSAFATVRATARTMRQTGGSVVLVSSAAALTGLPNHEAIAAAKAGIIGLTRSAAASYAGSRLRFNTVAPGLVRTELTEQLWSSETMAAGSIAMHALRRLGEPEDVASMIAYLLDPSNDWITGQVIGVDGGLAHIRGRNKR
jgi:NAD(P)-dependent dehydrogenase (short-subunit alcohol dehydrogenase family)